MHQMYQITIEFCINTIQCLKFTIYRLIIRTDTLKRIFLYTLEGNDIAVHNN